MQENSLRDALSLDNRGLDTLPLTYFENENIKTLKLYNNKLTSLPQELKKLRSLQNLDLASNRFAHLPPVVCTFTRLQSLDVSGNRLRTLPPQISNLWTLRTLNLADNNFLHIPAPVYKLVNLAELDVSGNSVESIHPDIGKLQSLTTLALDKNQLEELPAELFTLNLLTVLHLDDNNLTDIPPSIGLLTNLADLDIGDNDLTDLPDLEPLTKLRHISLDDNDFETLPISVTKLANLKELSVEGNKLRDLPVEIARLTSLGELNLRSNKMNAKALAKIMDISSLQHLNIEGNAIRYIPLEVLANLGKLNKIQLRGNPVEYPPLEVCLRGIEEMKKFQTQNPIPDLLMRIESEEDDASEPSFEEGSKFFLTPDDKERQKLSLMGNVTLTVLPGIIKDPVEFTARVVDGEVFRPNLEDSENFETDIIDLQPHSVSFSRSVALGFSLVTQATRKLAVMSSHDGIRWETHTPYKTDGGISVQITKLAMFVVVSSLVREDFVADPKGCTFRSTVSTQVCISMPAGSVTAKNNMKVEVMPVDAGAISASFHQEPGLDSQIAFSPVVFVKSDRTVGLFKKPVTLCLPLPPRGDKQETTMRIVADKTDTDDWQDVTDSVKPIIRETVVTFRVSSFSGYGAVSSTDRERSNVGKHAKKVYKNAKNGSKTARLLLLQHAQKPQQLLVSVVESHEVREKMKLFAGDGYESLRPGIPYSGDLVMRARQRINFQASDEFSIRHSLKHIKFYPTHLRFVEVTVEPQNPAAESGDLEGSLKFFMKQSKKAKAKDANFEQVAELKFILRQDENTATERQIPRRLKRSISYVTSTLLAMGRDWESFARQLGLTDEELDTIKSNHSEERDCLHLAMLKWKDKEGNGATNQTIIDALRSEGIFGMAEITEGLVKQESVLEEALLTLAEELPVQKWKQFGRSQRGLGLSAQEVEHIDADCRDMVDKKLRMLELWKSKHGFRATVAGLVDRLEKCELQHNADMLRATYL